MTKTTKHTASTTSTTKKIAALFAIVAILIATIAALNFSFAESTAQADNDLAPISQTVAAPRTHGIVLS